MASPQGLGQLPCPPCSSPGYSRGPLSPALALTTKTPASPPPFLLQGRAGADQGGVCSTASRPLRKAGGQARETPVTRLRCSAWL